MVESRNLVIVRHAKAERPEGYAEDFDRPLAERGRVDARAAGSWLTDRGLTPRLALCSAAVRTRETWLELGFTDVPVTYEPLLYPAGPRDALDLVTAVSPDVTTLLLLGHNPTMSMLSAYLDPDGATGDDLRTAGIAVHRVDGPWTACGPGQAPLVQAHTARG